MMLATIRIVTDTDIWEIAIPVPVVMADEIGLLRSEWRRDAHHDDYPNPVRTDHV